MSMKDKYFNHDMKPLPMVAIFSINKARTYEVRKTDKDIDIRINNGMGEYSYSFCMTTSIEFLKGISHCLTITRASIVASEFDINNVKIKFKIVKGMCRVSINMGHYTKIKTRFPVSDTCSFGHAVMPFNEFDLLISTL